MFANFPLNGTLGISGLNVEDAPVNLSLRSFKTRILRTC